MKLRVRLCLATALGLGLCLPAHAYVDPNSGGLVFQLLTPLFALAAAALAFARQQLFRIWDFLVEGLKTLVARFFKA